MERSNSNLGTVLQNRSGSRGSVRKSGSESKKSSKQTVFKTLTETLRSPSGSEEERPGQLINPTESINIEKFPTDTAEIISEVNDTKKKTPSQNLPSTSASLPPRSAVPSTGIILGDALKNLSKSRAKTSLPQEKSFIINEPKTSNYTRLDVPHGTMPPSMKDCHLSNVLRSARRCLEQLREVREGLSNLVAEDEHLSKGMKKINPGPELLQLSQVAEILTILSREAFVPAHRLNQTTIALYNAEDYLRYPTDIRTFDVTSTGRIKLPDSSFNAATVEKLRHVNDRATDFYNKFDAKGTLALELHDILLTLMRALQDFFACTMGIQEVFKVLLYTNQKEKQHLQQFLLSLPSMERSDMLTEVQDLRRVIDELVIFLEKLSWGSFVVYRLASGKSVNSTPDDTPSGTPKLGGPLNSYPAFNTLQKATKGSKTKIVNKKKSLTGKDKHGVEDVLSDKKASKDKFKAKDPSETSVTMKKPKAKKSSKNKTKTKKEKAAKNKSQASIPAVTDPEPGNADMV